jgi:hypothetical protein
LGVDAVGKLVDLIERELQKELLKRRFGVRQGSAV